MTYSEALQWLYEELPMYQRQGVTAYKPSLENITRLCDYLGNPQQQFKSIHIAGTNGKGSTAHMLASVLQENGYRVGLHTSPHLKHFEERNKINGISMDKEFLIDFVEKHRDFIQEVKASFFEVVVAMGFAYFAKEKVDIAIIETGLGGRLDATNIIQPIVSMITNVSLEHTAILGNILEEIAYEKGGIIKENTPIIIGEYTAETYKVWETLAQEKKAPFYVADSEDVQEIETDLKGKYQVKNKQTTMKTIRVLQGLGWELAEDKIRLGMKKVVENTALRGRWECLQEKPLIIADTAHNPAGLEWVMKQVQEIEAKQKRFVLGFVNDKDIESIISFFPLDGVYYFTQPDVERKMKIEDLKKKIPSTWQAQYFSSVKEALEQAQKDASSEDFIYVGGSTFVVAEVI